MAAIKFSTLADRAEKRALKKYGGKRPVFEIDLEDGGDIIRIEKPKTDKALMYEEAKTLRQQLQVLFGKDYARIADALADRDPAAATDLITSMWEQWEDDSSETVGGKEH